MCISNKKVEIKPGSLVVLKKSNSMFDGVTDEPKLVAWYEDKVNKDFSVRFFQVGTAGVFLDYWPQSPEYGLNYVVWYEILIGQKVYLFTPDQIEPYVEHTHQGPVY